MALRTSPTAIQIFSDFLSILTITLCFIFKIPQIINIKRVKSAEGISFISLCLELSSYTVMMSYNYRNHYAILTYLEYPIILMQELILILFVAYYKRLMNVGFLFGALVYFSIAFGMLFGVIPREFITFLVPLCTPIGASSKVVQLIEILQTKNAESVSILTWFISAFTNFTRIFTIFLDSADLTLLLNFSINTLLSSSIMLAAYYYKNKEIHKKHKE